MNKLFFTGMLCLVILSINAFAQSGKTFFQSVEGKWKGTLEYQDYTSNKRVKLNTVIKIKPSADGNSAEVFTVYDDFGKIYKSNSQESIDVATKKFSEDDTEFAIESIEDGKIVLIGKTQDGNTIEPTRKTITFSGDSLTILKETRTPWMFRNQLTLRKVAENTEAEKILSIKELQEDLAVFKKALTTLHPGIYRYNTPEQMEKYFSELEAKLKTEMGEREFFVLLQQTVSRIKCGHTYLNPYNQRKEIRNRIFDRTTFFPFYFRLIDRKMIVTGNLSSKKLAVGSEITKINGVPVNEIIEKLLTITTADGENAISTRLNELETDAFRGSLYAAFDIYFPLFFPFKDEIFEVEAVDFATKKSGKFQILAMTKEERLAETEKRYGKIPDYDDGWEFKLLDNSTAYLKIENSITWKLKKIEFKKFIADSFAELRAKNIKNLIIDLRGNDGGDTDIGFELARHLANQKLPKYIESRRLMRNVAPQNELLKNMDTYDKRLTAFLQSGVPANMFKKAEKDFFEFIPNETFENYPQVSPAENNFTGKSFIISDSSNASATFQFLNYAQENKLAAIVGQQTGGNKQGINGGTYLFVVLPNSKIEFDLPVFFAAPLTMQKDEGVIPDIFVKQEPSDVGNNLDREIFTIKNLIELK